MSVNKLRGYQIKVVSMVGNTYRDWEYIYIYIYT